MIRHPNNLPWKPLGNTGVHYWLVQRMAKKCGVDLAKAFTDEEIDPDAWAKMVQKCRACDCVSGCKRLLDENTDELLETPPKECLNAELFEILKSGQRTT